MRPDRGKNPASDADIAGIEVEWRDYREGSTLRLIDRIYEEQHRVELLGAALGKVLVQDGMLRADAAMTGPELLMAAETYLESPAPKQSPMLPEHCRAARAGLGLTIGQLADLSGVSPPTIARFEHGHHCNDSTVAAIQRALTGMAVTFLPDGIMLPGGELVTRDLELDRPMYKAEMDDKHGRTIFDHNSYYHGDVHIRRDGQEMRVPFAHLMQLVAEHVRRERMNKLEQVSPAEILGLDEPAT